MMTRGSGDLEALKGVHKCMCVRVWMCSGRCEVLTLFYLALSLPIYITDTEAYRDNSRFAPQSVRNGADYGTDVHFT